MLGKSYEFIGLMDHLEDKGLLETGEYFVVGVDLEQYDPLTPHEYLEGKNIISAYDCLVNERLTTSFN